MKTFNETSASKFIIVRSLGLQLEIVTTTRKQLGYVASQMFYAATLGQSKPRKLFIAELTDEIKNLIGDTKFEEIKSYDGAVSEHTYARSTFKELLETVEENQLTLDSVFASTRRRDFIMAFVSFRDTDTVLLAKFFTKKAATHFVEKYLEKDNHMFLDTRSFSENKSRELKEVFAYFNIKDTHEIPGSTMRAFSKNILELAD